MSWHLKAIIPRAKEESSEYINTNYIHAGGGRLVSGIGRLQQFNWRTRDPYWSLSSLWLGYSVI